MTTESSRIRKKLGFVVVLAVLVPILYVFLSGQRGAEHGANERRDHALMEAGAGAGAGHSVETSGAWEVRGLAVTWMDQKPLGDCTVYAYEEPAGHDVKELAAVFSNEAGAFELRLGPDVREVTLLGVAPNGWRSHGVRVTRSSETVVLKLALFRGRAISGEVVLPSGRPAMGAEVAVWCSARIGSARSPQRLQVVADDSGRFRVESMVGLVSFIARLEGYAQSDLTVARYNPCSDDGFVRLSLQVAQTIRGRVLSPEGAPVGGVTVVCYLTCGAGLSTTTSSDGSFKIDAVPEAGIRSLTAFHDSYGVARLRGEQVSDYSTLEFTAIVPSVRGRLVAASGRAADGETVQIHRSADGFEDAPEKTGLTSQTGEFTIADLEEGAYRLSSPVDLFRPIEVQVAGKGRLVDLGSIPVTPFAVVRVIGRVAGGWPVNVKPTVVVEDRDGRTRKLAGVERAIRIPVHTFPLKVSIWWRGAVLSAETLVNEGRAGEVLDVPLDVELDRLTLVKGRVHDSSTDAPVPFFCVMCDVKKGPDETSETVYVTSSDGTFVIAATPGEIQRISVYAQGYKQWQAPEGMPLQEIRVGLSPDKD